MTLEEALKLEAGRELDAIVAEWVMGWRRIPNYNYWMTQGGPGGFQLHELIATWKPSADISAAWRVVEKLPDRWLIACDRMGFHVKEVHCVTLGGIRFEAVYHTTPLASADTAPLAICRAALKACWKD